MTTKDDRYRQSGGIDGLEVPVRLQKFWTQRNGVIWKLRGSSQSVVRG